MQKMMRRRENVAELEGDEDDDVMTTATSGGRDDNDGDDADVMSILQVTTQGDNDADAERRKRSVQTAPPV
jgi:hypothetical protein